MDDKKKEFLSLFGEHLEIDPSILVDDFVIPEWDSLALVGCVAAIHLSYGVLANGSKVAACKTVGEIMQVIEATAKK